MSDLRESAQLHQPEENCSRSLSQGETAIFIEETSDNLEVIPIPAHEVEPPASLTNE